MTTLHNEHDHDTATGHGEKLSRTQEQAIVALLTTQTVADAAKAAGVAERTLTRWLKLPAFQAAYRTARLAVMEQAIAGLQGVAADAVATLRRNLNCGTPAVEVRAALGIIDQAFKAAELVDMAARLDALESALAADTADDDAPATTHRR